ncbi:protein nrt1/ ptr family 2.5 [Quercus suber]|uniref:Protein nrt1/ ptr family 2.5 n=1 Tax=Quercus suber TaxID=58331 RepID=A0AAW0KNE0_QUESU
MSTALIDVVQRVTRWLPNNINNGRLDNMYWFIKALKRVKIVILVLISDPHDSSESEKDRIEMPLGGIADQIMLRDKLSFEICFDALFIDPASPFFQFAIGLIVRGLILY